MDKSVLVEVESNRGMPEHHWNNDNEINGCTEEDLKRRVSVSSEGHGSVPRENFCDLSHGGK